MSKLMFTATPHKSDGQTQAKSLIRLYMQFELNQKANISSPQAVGAGRQVNNLAVKNNGSAKRTRRRPQYMPGQPYFMPYPQPPMAAGYGAPPPMPKPRRVAHHVWSSIRRMASVDTARAQTMPVQRAVRRTTLSFR